MSRCVFPESILRDAYGTPRSVVVPVVAVPLDAEAVIAYADGERIVRLTVEVSVLLEALRVLG